MWWVAAILVAFRFFLCYTEKVANPYAMGFVYIIFVCSRPSTH